MDVVDKYKANLDRIINDVKFQMGQYHLDEKDDATPVLLVIDRSKEDGVEETLKLLGLVQTNISDLQKEEGSLSKRHQ